MKTSCSIIIYNFESLHFLRSNIRQIRKFAHPDISQHIIISEQSEKEKQHVIDEFGKDDDITIVNMKAICSGYAIDYILRNVNIDTEFICTLDVDAFPIHKNWLYTSIKLLQDDNFSFVGVHADIESAYAKYGNFYCMAQYFRVGRLEDFKKLSIEAGFTRFTHRWHINEFGFNNNDWGARARMLNEDGWSDSSVTAHWWEDQYTNNDKFTYAVTHCIGEAGKEPLYGRITDGLIFHFAFSWTSLGMPKEMGQRYADWTRRIKENFSDELINEMLEQSRPMVHPIPRQVWNGVLKRIEESSLELNNKIENLKNATEII